MLLKKERQFLDFLLKNCKNEEVFYFNLKEVLFFLKLKVSRMWSYRCLKKLSSEMDLFSVVESCVREGNKKKRGLFFTKKQREKSLQAMSQKFVTNFDTFDTFLEKKGVLAKSDEKRQKIDTYSCKQKINYNLRLNISCEKIFQIVDNLVDKKCITHEKKENRQYICCSRSFLRLKSFFKEKRVNSKKESFFKSAYFFMTELVSQKRINDLTEADILNFARTDFGKQIFLRAATTILNEQMEKLTSGKQVAFVKNEELEETWKFRREQEEKEAKKKKLADFFDEFKKNRVISDEEYAKIKQEEEAEYQKALLLQQERIAKNTQEQKPLVQKQENGVYLREVKLSKTLLRKIKAIFPERENLTDTRIFFYVRELLEKEPDFRLYSKSDKCFFNFIAKVIASKPDEYVNDDPYHVYAPVFEKLGKMTVDEIEIAAKSNSPRLF